MNKLQRGDKLVMFDGQKAVTIWGDTGWNIYSGGGAGVSTPEWFTARIPIIFRGMTIRANAVANIPFDIIDDAGNVVDSTDDWRNKVGFLPHPETLFWLIEASWVVTGQSYLYQSKNSFKVVKILRYLAPDSVAWNEKTGKFVRTASGLNKEYPPAVSADGVASPEKESIVYLWPADPSVEWGAPDKYPGMAALHAMGVLYNMDESAAAFFKRGMMKITAFVVPPGTTEADKQQFEEKVQQTVTGVKNFFKSIFLRAGQVSTVDLGGGLEGLANIPLTKEKREDIAIALGVPMSKLFTESAAGLGGGGVVQADDKRLILDTALPDWKAIASILNQQVFSPLGYRLVDRHEKMEEFQADESQRAASLTAYVTAFDKNPELAMLLAPEIGLELSEETIAGIQAMIDKPEPEPEPVVPVAPVAPAAPVEQPDQEDEIQAEKSRWMRKALKALEKGKSPNVEFVTDIILPEIHQAIAKALALATDEAEIRAAFSEKSNIQQLNITDLVNELRLSRLALEKSN